MSDEKNKCIYCNKSYSTKTNLSKHNKICKLNPDYKSTETLKYELYHLNNLLIDKDKLLEQKDEEIRIQKNIIDRYVKNDDKISNQINTTNNTQNNITIIDSRIFGAIPSGKSESRVPDGSNNWSITDPTPGNPN
jgi:hypothetical protein